MEINFDEEILKKIDSISNSRIDFIKSAVDEKLKAQLMKNFIPFAKEQENKDFEPEFQGTRE